MQRTTFIAGLDTILSAKQREAGVAEKLLGLLDAKDLKALPSEAQAHPATLELISLMKQLKASGVTNVKFDMALMRGFDYYTGLVFEVYDTDPANNRSMLGGGRYDGLVSLFGVAPVPTVGFGWGDVTLANFLEIHHLAPKLKPETDLYVILVGDILAAVQRPLARLREGGLNVAVGLSGKKVGDQIKTATKKGVDQVLIIGESEIKAGKYNLRDLKAGTEKALSVEAIIKQLGKPA